MLQDTLAQNSPASLGAGIGRESARGFGRLCRAAFTGLTAARWLLPLVALALLLPAGARAAEHPAQDMVVSSTNEMLEILRNESDEKLNDADFLKQKVEEIIVPNLDFQTMTKLAVGKYWRDADDQQKTDLVLQFKQLLLNTYTGALTEYKGGEIVFQPFRPEERDDRAVVRSTFDQPTGQDVPVQYKLRDRDGWLIYDIEVNNISLVTSYRTAFANEINRGGIDGLLATLKKRNAKKS